MLGNKKLSKKTSENIFVVVMLAWPLLMTAVFWVYLNIQSLMLSFQKLDYQRKIVDYWVGLDNFVEFFKSIFADGNIVGRSILNAISYWALCFVISNPLYIFFSYVIFKKFWGVRLIRFMVMLPSMVSSMIFALVVKNFINDVFPTIFGADIDYFYGPQSYWVILVYDIWISFAISLIMYPNVMGRIPQELFESAQIDGCDSVLRELWHIILPGIYPTIQTFVITGVAGILSGSSSLITFYQYNAPIYVYSYSYHYTVQVMTGSPQGWPVLAAGGLVFTAIIGPLVWAVKSFMSKFGPTTD